MSYLKAVPRLVWAALALYLFDSFVLGEGVLALAVGALVVLVWVPLCLAAAFKARERLPKRAAVLGAFLLLPAAVIGTNRWNESLARRRADGVIAACRSFHQSQGRWPDTLEQLVPGYLPRIPAAKVGLSFNRFEYSAVPAPVLKWTTTPPYVKTYYDLDADRWWAAEE